MTRITASSERSSAKRDDMSGHENNCNHRKIKMQKQLNEEKTWMKQQIEQEKRDHELALRLAKEYNTSIENLSTPQVICSFSF